MKKDFIKRNIEPIAAGVIFTGLVGVSCYATVTRETKEENTQNAQVQEFEQQEIKVFGIGEHVISVPIADPGHEVTQYEYHEGYTPIGISSSSRGSYIMYKNDYVVECHPSGKNEEELVYCNFGYPSDYEKFESSENLDTKEFGIGEHIISVPIDDPKKENIQVEFYEGYEAIGMAVSTYGGYGSSYSGGCILYVNTEPVICEKTEENNGSYLEFGNPVEKELTKVKE